jgi:hypothetical protein
LVCVCNVCVCECMIYIYVYIYIYNKVVESQDKLKFNEKDFCIRIRSDIDDLEQVLVPPPFQKRPTVEANETFSPCSPPLPLVQPSYPLALSSSPRPPPNPPPPPHTRPHARPPPHARTHTHTPTQVPPPRGIPAQPRRRGEDFGGGGGGEGGDTNEDTETQDSGNSYGACNRMRSLTQSLLFAAGLDPHQEVEVCLFCFCFFVGIFFGGGGCGARLDRISRWK